MITKNDAEKFQKLFKEETGEKITLEEAFEMAESLVEMIRAVYNPNKNRSDRCSKGNDALYNRG